MDFIDVIVVTFTLVYVLGTGAMYLLEKYYEPRD